MGNIKEEEFDIEDPTHTGYSLVEYDLYTKLGLTIRKNLMNGLFEIVSIKTGHLLCISMDTENQIKSIDITNIGTLNANIVHPREIFYTAICHRSASIIIAHNHPSGNPTPSKEDIAVTEKLIEAGEILGIDVLDHVVIGDGRYVSLKDEGLVR